MPRKSSIWAQFACYFKDLALDEQASWGERERLKRSAQWIVRSCTKIVQHDRTPPQDVVALITRLSGWAIGATWADGTLELTLPLCPDPHEQCAVGWLVVRR
jgi:hypothetical protein